MWLGGSVRLRRFGCVGLALSVLVGHCLGAYAQVPLVNEDSSEVKLRPHILRAKDIESSVKATSGKTETAVEFKINPVEKCLIEGRLLDGEKLLVQRLKLHPRDDQARFGLGMTRFLRSIEAVIQDLHRYGLDDRDGKPENFGLLLDLPVQRNPQSARLTYGAFRQIVRDFNSRLAEADNTLSFVTDEHVELPVHFGLIKLDLNEDGVADEDESLWLMYEGTRNRKITRSGAKRFVICFDKGDVHWMRGYCHLLMSLCEFYLAHDSKDTFERTAYALFTDVDSSYRVLAEEPKGDDHRASKGILFDAVAFIHSISWDVVEPARMKAALNHLETMVAQNRHMWKCIMSETDNNREWIPNPKQDGVIPNMKVTAEKVDVWLEFMDQIDEILTGKLLIAFWRAGGSKGINLRRVFLEPRRFDLVYWVHGSSALPYLENGKTTKIEIWNKIQREFGSQFPGFAAWFN